MISSEIIYSPNAHLMYLVPMSFFKLENELDVTAMHVLEHWILEGGEAYSGSNAVFAEARRIGGSISASVSRSSLKIKLEYYAPLHADAVELLTNICSFESFDVKKYESQKHDVSAEIESDSTVTRLFDELYQTIFTGRYSLSGGGTEKALNELKLENIVPLIKALKVAPGVLFWAGPAGCSPSIVLGDDESAKNKLLALGPVKPIRTDVTLKNGNVGLVQLDTSGPYLESAGLGIYLRILFGNYIQVHNNVIPGCIVSAVSFDIPDISQHDIRAAIKNYEELGDDERLLYIRLAAAKIADEYSYSSGATRLDSERWMNSQYDNVIEQLLKIL